MKTTNYLKFFIFIALTGACSNDLDFVPTSDSTLDWVESFNVITSDNNLTLSRNNLSIIQRKQIKGVLISEKYFFEDEYAYLPVYLLDNTKFSLKQIDTIKKDTSIVSLQHLEKIKTKVCEIIDTQESFDFVEITWKKDNAYFKSMAVFDKITGELVYDNILYNIITSANYSGGFSNRIVSAEYENAEDEGSDYVSFSEENVEYAWVSLNWYEHGHWDFTDGPIIDDYFERTYFYRHDILEHHFDYGVSPKNGQIQHFVDWNLIPYTTIYDYSGTDYFRFKYYMCAAKNTFSFTPALYEVNTNISTDEYSIKVMEVDKHPTKQKELLPWYLHSMYLYW